MRFVLFDKDGEAVGFATKILAPVTMKAKGATSQKLASECSAELIERLHRRMREDPRKPTGNRRRNGGHGYSGGDGFSAVRRIDA